jgi:hypothetical protein
MYDNFTRNYPYLELIKNFIKKPNLVQNAAIVMEMKMDKMGGTGMEIKIH